MPLPILHRRSGESAMASYDFFDLATGIGYKEFYAFDAKCGGTASYSITSKSIYSHTGKSEFGDAVGARTYDLLIEKPLQLKGEAVAVIPVGLFSSTGVSTSTDIASSLAIISGATTTILGQTATETLTTTPGAGQTIGLILTASFYTGTNKLKRGDKLRLSVTTTAPGSNKGITHYHDPKGRTGLYTSGVTSILSLVLPFKIDL